MYLWLLGATLGFSLGFIVPLSTRNNQPLVVLGESHHDENCHENSNVSRRRLFQQAIGASIVAAIGSTPTMASAARNGYLIPTPPLTKDVYWPTGKVAFSLLPLAGTSTRRKTIESTVIQDKIWTHDQIQGIVNVNVPVRQTVVKLMDGSGLWVHNPVAPTPELIRMMRDLEAQHGPVRHIVLGTVALEHKATFPAFASKFPNATCWVQPGQWAFPLGIPVEFYGLQQRRDQLREIPSPDQPITRKYRPQASRHPVPEWTSDFDFEVLGPLKFRSVGAFSETAFYHRDTQSLILTDTVCSVTEDPPAIIQEDPRALLFHARDQATDFVIDTPENRRKGWRRMVQFGLIFFPSQIQVSPVGQALRDAKQVPLELQNLDDGAVPFNLYPWSWNGDKDIENFRAISQNGRLFCPPILTKLILDREPDRVLAWVDRVCQRFPDMKRILPSHLDGNVVVQGCREFSDAFDPLRSRPGNSVPQRALAEDLALLQAASDSLTELGVVAPSQVCDGEPARSEGRFALGG